MPVKDPDLKLLQVRLSAEDRARLGRIAHALGHATRGVGTPSDAVRWGIRELDARLALAETSRGAAPVVAEPGPMTPPPGR